MKLIFGLGNPEKREFESTRHNIGKRVLNAALKELADSYSFKTWEKKEKLHAEITAIEHQGKQIIFAKPTLYMNEAGKTAQVLLAFYKIKPDDLLVVHDDSDIFFGKLKATYGSRSAGHRGVESIIQILGTKNFWRLRIGVRPPHEEIRKKADQLILESFTAPEEKELQATIVPATIESIKAWLDKDRH